MLDRETQARWWAIAMNAAAYIEDAAACLQDRDAKSVAERDAKYIRQACNKLWHDDETHFTQDGCVNNSLEPILAQYRFRVIETSHPFYVDGEKFGAWHECSLQSLPTDGTMRRIGNDGYETEYRVLYAIQPQPSNNTNVE